MPTVGGLRVACNVRIVSTEDPHDTLDFPSLLSATKKAEELSGQRLHHGTIKRWAHNKAIHHGYRWELVSVDEDDNDNDSPVHVTNANVFTFHNCVESIFNGGQVRVTQENPRRASVIDVIRVVVGESANPRVVWQRLCAQDAEVVAGCYNLTFEGAGQRPTPVTDSAGVLRIINALPGRRARQFRASAMDVLIRFLAGDQSMHAELDDNAARQAQLPAEHPMRMFTEEVYAHPRSSKFLLHSPAMKNEYISTFYKRPVVYLLQFDWEGKQYIKVGWTDDFKERMVAHWKELPGCTIWCIYAISDPQLVESTWKEDFKAYCAPVKVNGKVHTELHIGVSIEEAEKRMVDLCYDQRTKSITEREVVMQERRMVHDLAIKEKEIELQRLQLQILQAQLALKTAGST